MAAISREIVFVTGGNSGIGFELACQLLAKGIYHVLLGARSHRRGTVALNDLQSRKLPGSVELVQLDVQDDEQINLAAQLITKKYTKLDILVNNAAVGLPAGATERERLQMAFDVNATGAYLLTQALIPLLRKSDNPRIINISSGAGSLSRRLMPESPMYRIQSIGYRASKVAFNMITACLHVEHGLGIEQNDGEKTIHDASHTRMKVFCYDPGFTASNLSPHNTEANGARNAKDTVSSMMDIVEGRRDADVGKFIHNTGEYPW